LREQEIDGTSLIDNGSLLPGQPESGVPLRMPLIEWF
jgi:hypothetical protein